MKAHLQRVGILCIAALAVPAAVRAEKPAPAKAASSKVLRLPETPYRYAEVDLPAHFRTLAARRFDNTPADNPITDHGATLGRVLFYDTRLSANNTTACASCHHQKNGFVDPNRVSKGFEGKQTDRHAPGLAEVRFYQRGRFFWDERAATLEEQVLMPIQSKIEMGQDLNRLTELLAKDKDYQQLFLKAFGDSQVTSERMARALAQFLRSMVSYQSKYDEGMAKAKSIRDDFANFTAQENQGKTLFARNCANCHLPGGQQAHFVLNRPQNNGLDGDIQNTDGGVGDITLTPAQMGLFKSPSLRNVEFTAPYMHDGRLATLEAVIDHYSKNVKAHPNVSGRLRRGLNFNDGQKAALVAFLKTLSDVKFLSDPRFADPFVVVVAAAEPAAPANPPARPNGRGRGRVSLTVEQIVERLMSFDKNKDGKISKDELPERMQDLIGRGDTNKDGVLDKDEIKALAVKLQQEGLPRGLAGGAPRGGNVDRALEDLKLTGPKQEKAAALVKAHQEETRKAQDGARGELLAKIQEVLSEDEFKKVKEASERGAGLVRRGRGNNLERALDDLKLPEAKQEKVATLVKASQEGIRKKLELVRADLIKQMKDVLSEEEFKKFQDAVQPNSGRLQAAAP